MKYNTPRQRIKIYERLIRMIDKGKIFFMCNELYDLLFEIGYCRIIQDCLPELWKVRPRRITGGQVWYGIGSRGMQYRKKRLQRAIEIAKYNCL